VKNLHEPRGHHPPSGLFSKVPLDKWRHVLFRALSDTSRYAGVRFPLTRIFTLITMYLAYAYRAGTRNAIISLCWRTKLLPWRLPSVQPDLLPHFLQITRHEDPVVTNHLYGLPPRYQPVGMPSTVFFVTEFSLVSIWFVYHLKR